ncbi:hypothetical protein J3R83DRAFT_9037, partial [Lanmaoa asiatica]
CVSEGLTFFVMPRDVQRSDDFLNSGIIVIITIYFSVGYAEIETLSGRESKGRDIIYPFFDWCDFKRFPDIENGAGHFSL